MGCKYFIYSTCYDIFLPEKINLNLIKCLYLYSNLGGKREVVEQVKWEDAKYGTKSNVIENRIKSYTGPIASARL